MFSNSVAVVGGNVGHVYLTNDLGFDKENLAFVSLITTPAWIVLSLVAGYFVSKRPIKTFYFAQFFRVFFESYYVLGLLGNFPDKENQTNWTIVHIAGVSIISSFEGTFSFVSSMAFINQVTDKRVSGIHITMLAALSNFSYFVHKVYIFEVIERFGIFVPQVFLSIIGFVTLLLMGKSFLALEDLPISAFKISDEVFKKSKFKKMENIKVL